MALTHEQLRHLLDYDPSTGKLRWKVSPRRSVKVGDIAGYVDGNGRRLVMIDQVGHHAGRLIWFWMTEAWPVGVIDHKDRDPLNNRWKNLRDVTSSVNNQNKGASKTSKSGVRGVYWNARMNRWHAQIALDKKKRHLGWFINFDDAVKARQEAEATLFQNPEVGLGS